MPQLNWGFASVSTPVSLVPAWALVFAAGFLVFRPVPAKGEGFRNPPAGAFSLGRTGGRVAQIDDASATAHNPANLNDLTETEFLFTPTLVYVAVDYRSPLGTVTKTRDPWKLLPNFFFGTRLDESPFAVGLGITTPYGLSNEWEPLGPFRYSAPHFTELKTVNVNPTLAIRLGDSVSLGLGLNAMWSAIDLRQFYPWSLVTGNPATPDAELRANGDGIGWGGNMGLTWQVTKRQRFAVTYRSPVSVDYSGTFNSGYVPAGLPWPTTSHFESHIQFPTIIGAGYGLQVSEKVRIETDLEWLEFSNFDQLPLIVQNPPPGLPARVNQAWKNTFTAGLGGDWRFAPNWVVRAGYQYYQSPVPDSTFSPTIPDANQHAFTTALGYRCKQHNWEMAYGWILYDDRHIIADQNASFNGNYRMRVHLFSLNYRYSF